MRRGRWHWATKNVGAASRSLDRVAVIARDDALSVVLADGAGGMAGGGDAADAVIAAERSWPALEALASNGGAAVAWLEDLDRVLSRAGHGGQTTAVVAVTDGERVVGASIGDSIAWTCGADSVVELTRAQHRKPLLGSGSAIAVPFVASTRGRRILVASDGLSKYADAKGIGTAAAFGDVDGAVTCLVELVRLPDGSLQDDVSLALVEHIRE